MPPTAHKLGLRGVKLGRIHGFAMELNVVSPTRTVSTPVSASIQGGSPGSARFLAADFLDSQTARNPFAFNPQDLAQREDTPAKPVLNPDSIPTSSPSDLSLYTPVIIPITQLRLPPSAPTPLMPVHANSPHQRATNRVFTVSAVLFSVFIGLTAIIILRMTMNRWRPCVGRIYRRHLRVNGKSRKEGSGKALVTRIEYDDKTWGTPARTRVGCKLSATQNQFHDHVLQFTSTPALLLETPRPSASLQTIQEEFDERLQDEEFDIALALNFALRNHCDVPPPAEGAFDFPASCDSPALHNPNSPESSSCGDHSQISYRASCSLTPLKETSCPYTLQTAYYAAPSMRHFDDADDISAMLSLQAGLQSLGRRTGRGGFGVSLASMPLPETSFTNEERKEKEGYDDDEEIFEVRHAQSKSVELRKGILFAWPPPDQSLSLPPVHLPPPSLIISSPVMSTSPSLDSTASSPSAGEAFLRPPGIVYPQLQSHGAVVRSVGLMTSSSSVSVDLDDFPLPPSVLGVSVGLAEGGEAVGGSFLSDPATDGAPGALLDKGTTVEQFIMMYGNV